MREMIGSLHNSLNSLKNTRDESGRANILVVPIQRSGTDTKKLYEKIYDSIPEKYKATSLTSYTGKTVQNEDDILTMFNVIKDLGYTVRRDRDSKRKTFFTKTFPNSVDEFQNKTLDEITDASDDLQREGIKNFIPSNIIDIYTRVKILLGFCII